VLCPIVAGAQPPSEERVVELMQAALRQTQGTPAPAPQAAPNPPAPPTELKLDDAVRLALEQNLDIAVERINPQTFDLSLAALRGNYRPTVTSTLGRNSTVNLPTSQLTGGARVENETNTYNFGMTQTVPWFGGSFAATWTNRRLSSTNAFNTYNPQFNASLTASFTQPLLRGLRIDTNRQQLLVTQINRDISELQLRATITNTVASVRSAYWDLYSARRAVEVAQRSLALAEKLVDDNKVRVEVGTLAPIDVVQAEAEAATRRQALTQAEATARTAELTLKRLIVKGTDDDLWTAELQPVDTPLVEARPVDLAGAIRSALSQRTDLLQSRRQLESSDVSLKLLRDQRLPAADLVATYGVQGIGGTQFLRQGSGLGSTVIGEIPGGYGDALSMLAKRDYPTWNLQVQLSYPIGTSNADAQYARAQLQRSQSQAQIRALELQVATEVTSIALQLESNLKRVDAARAARQLAERRLEAEQSKFEVGMSTNFFVVQAQRDLADAQNTELRATLDYLRSQVDFERVQLTRVSGSTSTAAASSSTSAAR
jgi:outer membrane protein TolC